MLYPLSYYMFELLDYLLRIFPIGQLLEQLLFLGKCCQASLHGNIFSDTVHSWDHDAQINERKQLYNPAERKLLHDQTRS